MATKARVISTENSSNLKSALEHVSDNGMKATLHIM